MSSLEQDDKIAQLINLLDPSTYPISDYVEALACAEGDVAKAAEEMLLPRIRSLGKRKAGTGLEAWLGKKRSMKADDQLLEKQPRETDPRTPEPDGSPSKPKSIDLMSVLRQPTGTSPIKAKTLPQPALHLTTQSAIDAHHLPLTILQSPLSPSLASALYLALMKESESWPRHQWYLAGNWVESPHLMTSYARQGGGHGDMEGISKYYYSGTELSSPTDYPELLKRAADLVEPVVNAALEKRVRYPLEWAGEWRANVCGANRYDGAASGVGWHADQLTYLGPYTTIASLSLGTPRNFRLRQTHDPLSGSGKPIRTYEINLSHNSLVLMNAGCQERYKHTVPTQKALDLFRPGFDVEERPIPGEMQKGFTTRINITFRFYRDDFHPLPSTGPRGPRQGTPQCKCGIPALLRADQKAKARSRLPPSPTKSTLAKSETAVIDDDMAFFWQCQSPGQTGDMKGCGFFRILDMGKEGRGPCLGDI